MKIYFDENYSYHLVYAIKHLNEYFQNEIEVIFLPDRFHKGIKDQEWMEAIASENAIVITQDKNIKRNKYERELYLALNIGIIFWKAPSTSGIGFWDITLQLVKKWPKICKLAIHRNYDVPFQYMTTLRKDDFESLN